jgi:hypothetical protein
MIVVYNIKKDVGTGVHIVFREYLSPLALIVFSNGDWPLLARLTKHMGARDGGQRYLMYVPGRHCKFFTFYQKNLASDGYAGFLN